MAALPRPGAIPRIAVVRRTYGNRPGEGEGIRIKAGTKLAVGDKSGDLQVITVARYKQLRDGKLVTPFDNATDGAAVVKDDSTRAGRPMHEEQGAAIRGNKGQFAKKKAEAGAKPQPVRPTNLRAASRRRTQVVQDPPAPEAISSAQPSPPDGSQTGQSTPASSSPAGPLLNSSLFKKRGTRAG